MLHITYEIVSLEKYGFDTKIKLKLIRYSEGDMIVIVKFSLSDILDSGFFIAYLKTQLTYWIEIRRYSMYLIW